MTSLSSPGQWAGPFFPPILRDLLACPLGHCIPHPQFSLVKVALCAPCHNSDVICRICTWGLFFCNQYRKCLTYLMSGTGKRDMTQHATCSSSCELVSSSPSPFRRSPGKWIPDSQLGCSLRSQLHGTTGVVPKGRSIRQSLGSASTRRAWRVSSGELWGWGSSLTVRYWGKGIARGSEWKFPLTSYAILNEDS